MSNYTEKDIQIIKDDVEKIKVGHDMYIGCNKWDAVIHLLKEVLQNSIDEAANEDSPCDEIFVDVDEQTKAITISDNGRGIPLGVMEQICTLIQSSGKFKKGSGNAYKFSAGKFGVGITAVNALSVKFIMIVMRDGIKKTNTFEFGHIVDSKTEKCPKSKHGTTISFIPNEEILGKAKYNHEDVLNLCETMTYLSKVNIMCHVYTKNGKDISEKYVSKNGIKDLITKLCPDKIIKPIYIRQEETDKMVEVAFTYAPESEVLKNNGNQPFILSYANYCTTVEGGTHEVGFRQGLANAMTKFVKENCLNKKEANKLNIIADDTRVGLVAVVNILHINPEFSGQIKAKLINDDIISFVRDAVNKGLRKWYKENEKDAKKVGDWIKSMAKVRLKSSEEKKAVIKDGFSNAFSKNKIKNYKRATGNKNLELIIVEGDSAGGTANQARDKSYQELFYLRGVIKNTLGLTTVKALDNAEVRGMITCIGTNYGKNFNIDKCRYDKIIIATDADSDGFKITSLLSVLFLVHLPGLVEAGKVYKSVPPLYKVQEGKRAIYLKDNKAYAEYLQNKIANAMDIYKVEGSKKKDAVKLKKSEVVDLIVRNKNYVRDIVKLSRQFVCDTRLVELIALYHDDIVNNDMKKISKEVSKKFEFLELKKEKGIYVLEGLVDKEYQYVRLTDKTLKRVKDIAKHIKKAEEGNIYYMANDKVVTLYELLKIFETYEPAHKQRYKGLGEMNASQLWETTLNPESRVLIQLTTDDIKKDLETFNLIHGKKEECRNERKLMMSKFKIDLDDIDN